ncbi:sensor histidine kinase [Intrasporangium sp.]|uniref:sensor histidine kinase n=1 Tax=Intrasporangium sp. TaxID=1925024 RepID=UPI00293A723C|nr:sensor histidine kinase [Intrasporangium sp.]MDV3220310.1 sensor histidine kinase [Intrasporangium sp.]
MPERTAHYRLPVWVQDVLLALFVTAAQVQGTVSREAADLGSVMRPLTDLGHLGFVLLVASGVVLTVRRRWPVAVFAFTALVSLTYYTLDFPDGPGWLGLFVALYTLTALGDGRRSVRIAAVGILALSVGWLVAAADLEPRAAIGWVFFRIGASVMSAALGESVRSRRFIAAEALERAELAERTREEEARARVDEERLRIAREVHDTVAHAIAIINVQAGVTAHILDKRPERARETLEAIEHTSARALQDMRTILGVLRDANDGRVPHPGIGQIDELTSKARDAGLDLRLQTGPLPATVPSAVGSAVYRILQESITNVLRHVGPTRVDIALGCTSDVVEVRVTDGGRRIDGQPSAPAGAGVGEEASASDGDRATAPTGAGRGILGMRERCQLLGGELDAQPVPGGGFQVTARLPLAPAGLA